MANNTHLVFLIGAITLSALLIPLVVGGGNSLNIGVDGLDVAENAFKIIYNNTGASPEYNVTADSSVDELKLIGSNGIDISVDYSTDTITFDGSGVGGSGEANTASNVGSGSGVFKTKNVFDLQFKSILSGGDGIVVTPNTDDITLSLNNIPKSEIALAGTWIKADLPTDIVYRDVSSCSNGDFIKWQSSNSTWICATGGAGGEVNTASNVGTGDGWFKTKSSEDLQFKSIIVGGGITATPNTNDITLGLSNIPKSSVSTSGTWVENDLPTISKSKISATGTFPWAEVSKSGSLVGDMGDVVNGCANGDILEYQTSNSTWICATDNTGSGIASVNGDSTSAQVFSGVTGNITITDTGAGTLTFNTGADIVTEDGTQTLINKSISGSSNTLSNIAKSSISATGTFPWTEISKSGSTIEDLGNVVNGCANNEYLKYQTSNSTWICAVLSGSENTSATNLGTGFGVFSAEVGDELRFDSLIGGTGIDITDTTDDLTFSIDNTVITTSSNIGSLADVVNGCANGNVLEYQTSNSTWICATDDTGAGGEANTASSSGLGESLVLTKSGVDLPFRGIAVSGDLSIASNSTDVTISYTDSGSGVTSINSDSTASQVFSGVTGNITITDTGAGTLTFNTGADIVTEDGTQTLINKSISGSSNTLSNIAKSSISATGTFPWSEVSKSGSSIHDLANVTSTGCADGQGLIVNSTGYFICAATGDNLGNHIATTDLTMGTNYIDITEIADPGAPSSDTVRLFAFDTNGNTRFRYNLPDGTQVQVARDNYYIARNTSGGTIDKCDVVYVTGSTGQRPNIDLARANSDTTMPATGYAGESISNSGFGRVMFTGVLDGCNTNGISEGSNLWVSDTTAGDFTSTKPNHPNYSQRIGTVLNEHTSNGSILVNLYAVRGDHEGTNLASWKIGDDASGTKSLIFRNGFDYTLQSTPTADRVVTLPDKGGTVAFLDDISGGGITSINGDSTASQVFSGVTGNITITDTGAGTLTFNTGADIVTETGTQTLTGKTISGSDNTLSNIAKSSISATGTFPWAEVSKSGSLVGDMGDVVNGCANGDILEYQTSNSTWICATDNTGSGIASINGDSTSAQVFSGSSNELTITDTGAGTLTFDVGTDIVQIDQSNTYTGSNAQALGTSFITFGSDPADAGSVRLSNTDIIGWESDVAGTDITLSVDASEDFVFGTGANNINMNSNPLTNALLGGTLNANSQLITSLANPTSGTDAQKANRLVVGSSLVTSPCADQQILKYQSSNSTWICATPGGGASPLSTKGDLYTFTTVDARLPVGATNGMQLKVNSATSTGLEWSNTSANAVKTTGTTLTLDEEIIFLNPSTTAYTITLPTASGNAGKHYKIFYTATTGTVVTIDGNGAETINGVASITMKFPNSSLDLFSTGSNWAASYTVLNYNAENDVIYIDDCLSSIGTATTVGAHCWLGWTELGTGTETGLFIDGELDHQGIKRLGTSAASGDDMDFFLGSTATLNTFDSDNTFDITFIIRPSTAITTVQYKAGATLNAASGSAVGAEHVLFLFDSSGAITGADTTHWVCSSRSAGGVQSTATSVTVTLNTWYNLRVIKDSGTIRFLINDVNVCNHSTQIPTGVLSPYLNIDTLAASARTLDFDYFRGEFIMGNR